MKTFTMTAATVGALAATALGLAGAAAAAPLGGSSASDAVGSLQAQGYNVVLNGSVTARCRTALSPVSMVIPQARSTPPG